MVDAAIGEQRGAVVAEQIMAHIVLIDGAMDVAMLVHHRDEAGGVAGLEALDGGAQLIAGLQRLDLSDERGDRRRDLLAARASADMIIGKAERAEIFGRAGDEIALGEIAAELARGSEIGLGLDALGDDRDAQRMGEARDLVDDRLAAGALAHAIDEGAVDLEIMGIDLHQHLEAGKAAAEIVDGDAHIIGDENLDQPLERGDRFGRAALGKLHAQIGGLDSRPPGETGDEARIDIRIVEHAIVDIDEQADRRSAAEIAEGLHRTGDEHPLGRAQLAARGGTVHELVQRGEPRIPGQPGQRLEAVSLERGHADDRLEGGARAFRRPQRIGHLGSDNGERLGGHRRARFEEIRTLLGPHGVKGD